LEGGRVSREGEGGQKKYFAMKPVEIVLRRGNERE
jgi:hypothetical protein